MNKYKTFLISTVYLLILDIVFSLIIHKHLIFSSILFYILSASIISSIISLALSLFKERVRKVLKIIIFSFITVLYIAQFVHYSFYECFFSIYSLFNGSQVFGFTPAIIKVIFNNFLQFSIFIVLLIFIITIFVKMKDEHNNKLLLSIVLLVSIIITTFSIYIPNSNSLYSRKNLLSKANAETKNVQSFGLISAMSIDLYRYVLGNSYDFYIDKNSDTYSTDKYNVKNIDFNIKTDDEELLALNDYIKNSKPTNKNSYTGIFKNKNLIFITAESFSFSLIDKDLTPTLYKLSNEGLKFSNFYTPIYYASTSDGEYTNLTGLLPKEGVWSYLKMSNNTYPYSYSNVFKDKGYIINGYHNGVYTFYNRDKVMSNLGYNFKACGNGLEKNINCNLWPQSDDEMVSKTYYDYNKSNKFYTYYMSISGHLYHSFKNNDMALKYKDKVKNLDYSDTVKAYISANMDLDKALEHLLENLSEDNKLDDTVIVLVPDHYPYGLSNKEYSELRSLNNYYDKHKSGLIIYNSGLESKTIDKYASNIDVLPTLLNMFGIEYDSRLLIGKDIMSDSLGIVIFNNRSYLTKEGFYDENTNKFTSFTKVNNGFVKDKQKEVFNKVNASSMIMKKDYYKYVK